MYLGEGCIRFGNIFLSSQKDIDPEIAKYLTNDFFNNLIFNDGLY